MRHFEYARAESAQQAIAAHGSDRAVSSLAGGAAYLAGGTTLLDLVKLDIMQPHKVVDINGVALDEIER
ncbi:MAG: FAD binding domain-containing protein, partial [Pseudomonadota bacterium]|nr:FAD binding domain-containing protein [Pseudomonadota bacterium]